MASFSHLSKLHVKDNATAEFVFYGIAGEPTLTVRPATSDNASFFNAVLKKSKQLSRKMREKKVPTKESIKAARLEDIDMFAEHVVSGWGQVVDSSGADVPFSKEVCVEFLRAIPGDMFDDLRAFCLDISNFRAGESMDPEELEELQGN